MVEVWTNIDAAIAESSLRSLRRRLSELDDALTQQQALIREHPDSFAMRLAADGLLSMQGRLQEDLKVLLRHRANERIQIKLEGENFVEHSASLSDLGVIFTRFQRLYWSIAQAITTGPTLRGPISTGLREATNLRLESTFPSSFGLSIFVPSGHNLLGQSLASDALEQLFQLLAAAREEDKLMRMSGEIGRRALAHLRTLAAVTRDSDSSMAVEWKDFAGTQYQWGMNEVGAASLVQAIDNIREERSETRSVQGRLVGASLLRNRFEILLDTGAVIEGKFVTGIGADVQQAFGQHVKATVDETEVVDRASGNSRTYHALRAITLAAVLE